MQKRISEYKVSPMCLLSECLALTQARAAKGPHCRKPWKTLAVKFCRSFFLSRGLMSPFFLEGSFQTYSVPWSLRTRNRAVVVAGVVTSTCLRFRGQPQRTLAIAIHLRPAERKTLRFLQRKGGDLSPTTSAWFPPGNGSRVANLVGLVPCATFSPMCVCLCWIML